MTMRPVSRRTALAGILGSARFPAWGNDYPQRPITVVIPWPAGGAADAAIRIISERLGARLRATVLVDNKPGANSFIGAEIFARSPADGYTLFDGNPDTLVLNPQTRRRIPYDPARFEPVAFIGRVPGVLVARPGLGVASGPELIRLARRKPGQISLASWGLGSVAHLGMLMLEQAASIELLHVPYKGTSSAIADVLGGRTDLVFVTPAFALSSEREGKLRIIGATSTSRISYAPAIASLAEQGFPGFELDTWNGFMAPRGTPAAVVEVLNRGINEVLRQPDTAAKLLETGHEISALSPGQFGAFIREQYERWGKIIRQRKLRVEET